MLFLRRLWLADFRNYETLDLEFGPGRVLLLGENAQGKSNLLEAIHFLSLLRSFRASRLELLRRWRQRRLALRGEFVADGQPLVLGVEYGEQRRLRLDGQPVRRASEFIGRVPVVAFVPEDLELVKGPASGRRRFLDMALTQVRPAYLGVLQAYDRALRSRNQLLREPGTTPAAGRAFDGVLAASGARLTWWRAEFLRELDGFLASAASQLLPAGAELNVRYQPAVAPPDGGEAELTAALHGALAANWDRDRALGLTSGGPHRDDFGLWLNGKSLGGFGSEGQCRLVALVLRLAAAGHLAARQGPAGVLLLVDDVLGELDERGRRAFLQALHQAGQVFVAGTQPSLAADLAPADVRHVVAGRVTPAAQNGAGQLPGGADGV